MSYRGRGITICAVGVVLACSGGYLVWGIRGLGAVMVSVGLIVMAASPLLAGDD